MDKVKTNMQTGLDTTGAAFQAKEPVSVNTQAVPFKQDQAKFEQTQGIVEGAGFREAQDIMQEKLPELREKNQDKLKFELPIEGRNRTIGEKIVDATHDVFGKTKQAFGTKQDKPVKEEEQDKVIKGPLKEFKGTVTVPEGEAKEGVVEGADIPQAKEILSEKLPEIREFNKDKLAFDLPIEGRNKNLGEKIGEAFQPIAFKTKEAGQAIAAKISPPKKEEKTIDKNLKQEEWKNWAKDFKVIIPEGEALEGIVPGVSIQQAKDILRDRIQEVWQRKQQWCVWELPLEGRDRTVAEKMVEAWQPVAAKTKAAGAVIGSKMGIKKEFKESKEPREWVDWRKDFKVICPEGEACEGVVQGADFKRATKMLGGRIEEIWDRKQDKLAWELPTLGRDRTVAEKMAEAWKPVAHAGHNLGLKMGIVKEYEWTPEDFQKFKDWKKDFKVTCPAGEAEQGIVQGANIQQAKEMLNARLPEVWERNQYRLGWELPIMGRDKKIGEKLSEAGHVVVEKTKEAGHFIAEKTRNSCGVEHDGKTFKEKATDAGHVIVEKTKLAGTNMSEYARHAWENQNVKERAAAAGHTITEKTKAAGHIIAEKTKAAGATIATDAKLAEEKIAAKTKETFAHKEGDKSLKEKTVETGHQFIEKTKAAGQTIAAKTKAAGDTVAEKTREVFSGKTTETKNKEIGDSFGPEFNRESVRELNNYYEQDSNKDVTIPTTDVNNLSSDFNKMSVEDRPTDIQQFPASNKSIAPDVNNLSSYFNKMSVEDRPKDIQEFQSIPEKTEFQKLPEFQK